MNVRTTGGLPGLLLLSALSAAAPVQAMENAPEKPSAREQALEARVAELERQVRALLEQRAEAPPSAMASTPPAPAIQATPILPNAVPGKRFSYGGFIKLEAVASDTDGGEIPDSNVARFLYVPSAIPVGAPDEGVDLTVNEQFSRFWFAADGALDDGTPLRAYLEFDLLGSALGNQIATNTFGLSVRHAYANIGRWQIGQNWSNFQDPASLVDSIDLIGATDATVFVRQPQLRYTHGAWSLSLENPETLFSPAGSGFAKVASDDNRLPDFTVRWTHRGDGGHWSVAGLLREIHHETTAGINATAVGYGLSFTGRRVLGPSDDVRFGLTAGRALGRYIGLAIAPDAVLDANGDLEPVDSQSAFAGWRHAFSPKLRGSLYASASMFDNDVALSGGGATEKVGSIAANLIYTPHPKFDVGLEGRLARRWLEDGREGDLARLHFHVKYSF